MNDRLGLTVLQIERRELWETYRHEHSCCPMCGNPNVSQTTIGVYIPPDKVNHAKCKCGWSGLVHALVAPRS